MAQNGIVLLSGGSGMLGKAIDAALKDRGFGVLRLVRRVAQNPDELHWYPNVSGGDLDFTKLEGLRGAIHLSGANVATKRWTQDYKNEMTSSRVRTTSILADVLAKLSNPPPVLISASAIGFYGDRGEEILDEMSEAGTGFFAELCTHWEQACSSAVAAGIRVVHPRFGMVLGPGGGALARLAPLFRLGLGGRLGSGRQWMSWISETDAVAAVMFALREPSLAGGFNAVAPEAVTNAEFTKVLGRAVHRPTVMAAPAFALRLAFGEMADEALLASCRAVPGALTKAGFPFTHATLAEALAAALG